MKKDEAQGEARSEDAPVADGSVDSLMRAVAHVPTPDAALRATPPAAELQGVPATLTVDAPQPRPLSPTPIRATPATSLEVAVPIPQIGELLGGRYELTELLGSGGMGAVFAAKHRGTGREVAIKVLLPSERGQRWKHERLARFVREAKAAGRIRHPNVVDVYDVEGEAEPPHIVMERLYGESLWQRIKRGPMPADEALHVMLAAMRGVSEAHRQGVIHRDLKPDNIFLALEPEHALPVPKVLDFGVSRILTRDDADAPPTALTRTGYILGTPSYMPLEQLRGQIDVDARADVYSLGVIVYEALCGQRPYGARNDHDLVIRMMTEPPTPLSERAPSIDAALTAIVMRALARDAPDRYQDVESFAAALERWLAGDRTVEPSPGLPTPLDVRAVEPPVSEPAPASESVHAQPAPSRSPSLVVTLVILLLGVVAWMWSARFASPSPVPALLEPASAPPDSKTPAAPIDALAPAGRHDAPAPSTEQASPATSTTPAPAVAPLRTPTRALRSAPKPLEAEVVKPAREPATKLKPEDF